APAAAMAAMMGHPMLSSLRPFVVSSCWDISVRPSILAGAQLQRSLRAVAVHARSCPLHELRSQYVDERAQRSRQWLLQRRGPLGLHRRAGPLDLPVHLLEDDARARLGLVHGGAARQGEYEHQ